MGLTIHYDLATGVRCDDRRARALIRRLHRVALRFAAAGRVDAVGPITDDVRAIRCAERLLSIQRQAKGAPEGEMVTFCDWLPALRGFGFRVDLGADCEPLWLALCRYHAGTVVAGRQWVETGLDRGWHYRGFCKTQYASLHGWEPFFRCHTAALDLLAACRQPGLHADIKDEGEYWPRRSERALRRHLGSLNAAIAGFAGAIKDLAANDAPAIHAPIFAHPQFERLEAEGATRHAAALDTLSNEVRQLLDF